MKDIQTTTCKVCGEKHRIDTYRGMTFYVCPQTMRVYLVAGEKKDV